MSLGVPRSTSLHTGTLQKKNKSFGAWGETQACLFLERQGFSVLERNYHATVGEIDIVAKKDDDYYFVEVKTRREGALATDASITFFKRRKLEKTIRHYCYHRNIGTTVSLVTAGLLVIVKETKKQVYFRLAVFC